MTEQWRPIPGYEGIYEVSDAGRVRGLGRYVPAKLGSQRWQPEKIHSPGRLPTGHLTVSLRRDGRSRSVAVHRLVLLAFVGEPPPGTECCHGNGNPADNRLSNLRWDTKSANVLDSVRHGAHHNTRKTHCINGHGLTEENLYRYGRKRKCKTCTLQLSAARHAARRAAS